MATGQTCMLCAPRRCTVTGWRKGREPLTNADETVLTGRYCFQLNSLLRGSQSAEMNKSFHLQKHSAAEQLLREVKCFHCIVPSRIWKAADCDLWKTVSEDAALAACKTLSAAPQEHYPNLPIKSQEHTLPKLGGGQGEKCTRVKQVKH